MFLVIDNKDYITQAFRLKSNSEVFDNILNYDYYEFKKLKAKTKINILNNLIDNYECISLYVSNKKRNNGDVKESESLFYNLYCSVKKEVCDRFIKTVMVRYLNYVLINNEEICLKFIFDDINKEPETMYDYLIRIFNQCYEKLMKEKKEENKDKPKGKQKQINEVKPLKAYKKIDSKSGIKILRPIKTSNLKD